MQTLPLGSPQSVLCPAHKLPVLLHWLCLSVCVSAHPSSSSSITLLIFNSYPSQTLHLLIAPLQWSLLAIAWAFMCSCNIGTYHNRSPLNGTSCYVKDAHYVNKCKLNNYFNVTCEAAAQSKATKITNVSFRCCFSCQVDKPSSQQCYRCDSLLWCSVTV